MFPTSSASSFEFLRPVVTGWLGKIELAQRHKKVFNEIAEQCTSFFSGATGFMWEPAFRQKFLKGNVSPRFKITIAKAFELVALYGPTLYWENPQRSVKPHKPIDLSPDLFGPLGDPMTDQIFQQQQQQQQFEFGRSRVRSQLVERYLNYTPREQPNGGLAQAAELAITEALIKGRGCLWTEHFELPGSGRTLTGSFWDSVDNLLIDPDAESIETAKWIARRNRKPIWEVERLFKLKAGSLKGKGTIQSGTSQGESRGDDFASLRYAEGQSFDIIEYYEVWSKGGVGTRLTGVTSTLKDGLEEVVGDYAYIVVAADVPYPLNAPSQRVATAYEEDLKQMFAWPVPYWRQDRWPVSCLDFYRKPRSAWPIAPLAPGLGELVFLNVIISHVANRIWSSSRDLICVLKSAAKNVKDKIEKGEDQAIIELDDVHEDINKIVQFLQQPQMNTDVWNIVDRVTQMFEDRVGLNELMHGRNAGGTQSRTAADARAKDSRVSIRPEYMAGKVETWITHCSQLEKFCCRWHVGPQDVQPLFGNVGAHLWQQLITNEDPSLVVFEMDCTVEAGSIRKPNKDRDVANLQTIMPALFPELSKHADRTSDTGPLNNLITLWGEAIDQDVAGVHMGPRSPEPAPQPDPQQVAQQQQEMQQQQQQHQMELETKNQQAQIDLQNHQIDLQIKGLEFQQSQVALQQKQAEAQQAAYKSQLEMHQAQQQAGLDAQSAQQDAQHQAVELGMNREKLNQELVHEQQKHMLSLNQMLQESAIKIKIQKQAGQQKIQQQKAQARQARRATPSGART